ncbi:hypothetical protein [Maridesulfovibrio bastinii]|uniref:hypothetical protein n=1 Tax=Maridesulfovibrio bastinii TaxID=47157 RepID=UPI000424A5BD|nr:hypothetical protein [Maridesulfovibrio bastinii]
MRLINLRYRDRLMVLFILPAFLFGMAAFILFFAHNSYAGWPAEALKNGGKSFWAQNTSDQKAEEDHDDTNLDDSMDPGEWDLVFGLDDQLFPSAIIALSMMRAKSADDHDSSESFGSPLAMATVYIRGKSAGDRVTVEISSTGLIRPSKMTVVLADPDKVYDINPQLKYEYEKLLSIRQPYPEDVTARVYLNGELIGEKTRTVIVRSINDCFFGMYIDNSFSDWSEMFAAYVNEGDPLVDGILGEALKKGYIDAFFGYQGSKQDVLRQIAAVWRVLQDRGIKYSSITTTSVESDTIMSQHVRLVGESTRGGQANCADGSVLLASVFRKLGLNAYLVILPGHMMVGVGIDNENSSAVYIETTMISDSTINEAMASAEQEIKKYGFESDDVHIVDINNCRSAGILPLREIYN